MNDELRAAGDALAAATTEVVGWSGLPSELWAPLADARDAYRAARDAAPADEIDRLRARVAELEAADVEWDRLLTAAHARVDEVQARADEWHRVAVERGHRVAELETAGSPDDAHTTTETRVEYRVTSRTPGGLGRRMSSGENVERARKRAEAFRSEGSTDVRVESRTVSTTTRTTDWKADES